MRFEPIAVGGWRGCLPLLAELENVETGLVPQ